MCRCDGIGRRSGLKIHRWRQRTGSSPVTGTKRKSHPKGWLFLLVLCGHSAEPAVRPTTLQKCEPQATDFWSAECVQRAKRVAVRSPAPKKAQPLSGLGFFHVDRTRTGGESPGSGSSAAGGGCSEKREWQRSKFRKQMRAGNFGHRNKDHRHQKEKPPKRGGSIKQYNVFGERHE